MNKKSKSAFMHKLEKLPLKIATKSDPKEYFLNIRKYINCWSVEYTDDNNNYLLISEHRSLQEAVDRVLQEIKLEDYVCCYKYF